MTQDPGPGVKKTAVRALSRENVLDHALAVADDEGLDAVSVRRIAQHFGVTPMALYWHVKGKEELLEAMGDRMVTGIQLPAAQPDLGIEQFRVLLSAVVDALRQHPGCAELAAARFLRCEAGQQVTERALAILRTAGFSPRQSANLVRAALHTSIMLVSGRPGAEIRVRREARVDAINAKQVALRSLPSGRFPLLVESATVLTQAVDETAYYTAGIDLYMTGITELARQ